jgi:Arc/MetJ-type ribon-helix-helix transcriptional regulator
VDTQQTAFRLPRSLLKRLDAHVEQLRRAQPGLNISRADAVRMLLTRALDSIERRKKP